MARHLIGNALRHQRNRFYVPTTGQFTQQDPIGLAGGVNLYAFAGGDPLNFRDPFGLCPWCKGEAFREIGRRLAPAQGPLEAMGVLATLPLGGATSKVGSEALAIGASFRAASAGRALAASAASKGRALIAQEGRHSLTLNRHAATGSQTSKLAHDFISAGLEFDDAVTAVARDIGPLARLAPGVQKGTVELGGRAIGCSRNTLQTGETSEPLDSRTMKLQDVADELELAEAQGASAKVLDLLMQRISTEAELWQLADLLIVTHHCSARSIVEQDLSAQAIIEPSAT